MYTTLHCLGGLTIVVEIQLNDLVLYCSVPFRYFGNGGGPSELGKSACEIWKLGKVEMCLKP